jgi:uroporphyrinogen-III synthase
MVRMLVTRPEPDAHDTALRLAALDIEAVTAPLLIARTLPTSLPEPTGFAAMAASSAAALRALEARGALAPYRGLKLFAVGDKTARVAREHGFAQVVSCNGNFAGMVEAIAHSRLSGPVFYPAARDQSGDLARSLAPYGVMVITTQIYAMDAASSLPEAVVTGLRDGSISAALFYSRRTAATFVAIAKELLDLRERRRLGVLCLSEAIAEPLIEAHFVRAGLADTPSEEAMMRLALSFARDRNAS